MKNTQYLGYFLYKMKITMVAIEHPNNLMRLFVEISKNGNEREDKGLIMKSTFCCSLFSFYILR